MQIVANNSSITANILNKISYPTNNSYKVLIFGKNKSGVLIGKYIGYSIANETSFTYLHLDPDDSEFGQLSTISIP